MARLSIEEAGRLAHNACVSCGAGEALAGSLTEATISATLNGQTTLGFPHLLDYLKSLREGRIDGRAEPRITQPAPTMIVSDAQGGIAQLGFDRAFAQLAKSARELGMAVFTQKNSYTTGELGYYARRLAGEELISLAFTNGPALMAAAAGGAKVYCTNPMAFGAPLGEEPPLIIDQASSATAFVNLIQAAAANRPIPEGWAVDANGAATTSASEALQGALLPFGGYKGANIALMVEVLAAGLSGAAWSLDAGSFQSGDVSPNAGLTIIALAPELFDPEFSTRLAAQVRRLEENGVHIPGRRRASAAVTEVDIDDATFEALNRYAESRNGG